YCPYEHTISKPYTPMIKFFEQSIINNRKHNRQYTIQQYSNNIHIPSIKGKVFPKKIIPKRNRIHFNHIYSISNQPNNKPNISTKKLSQTETEFTLNILIP